jgi:hypothetical protein
MSSTTFDKPSASTDFEFDKPSGVRLELVEKFREDSSYKFAFTGKLHDRAATLIVMSGEGESRIFGSAVKRLKISTPDNPSCPARKLHNQLHPSAQLPDGREVPAPWMISATMPFEDCRILYQVPECTKVRIKWALRTPAVQITLGGSFDGLFEGTNVTFAATIRDP